MRLRNTTALIASASPWQLPPPYPDTAEGAIRFLNEISVWNLESAKATAVPYMEGVWVVTDIMMTDGEQGQFMVYLKGYRDLFDQIRIANDFDEAESSA